jgi:hypothetical protein
MSPLLSMSSKIEIPNKNGAAWTVPANVKLKATATAPIHRLICKAMKRERKINLSE